MRWTRKVERSMDLAATHLALHTGVPKLQILRMMEEGGRFTLGTCTVQFESPGLVPLPGQRWIEADSYAEFR